MILDPYAFTIQVGRKPYLVTVNTKDLKWLDKFNLHVQARKLKSGRVRKTIMCWAKDVPNNERVVFQFKRLLVDAKPGQKIIHRNGNPLDLRRSNLEVL